MIAASANCSSPTCSSNGFRVTVAATAAEARERMRSLIFDLVVLDIMMPGESGVAFTNVAARRRTTVCRFSCSPRWPTRRTASWASKAAAMIICPNPSSRASSCSASAIFSSAASAKPGGRSEVHFGDFAFNLPRGELRRAGELVKLTTRERDFLRILATRAGHPVARTELAPPGSEEGARSVDVQINRLRQKIEADPSMPLYLQTVRGSGYVLLID